MAGMVRSRVSALSGWARAGDAAAARHRHAMIRFMIAARKNGRWRLGKSMGHDMQNPSANGRIAANNRGIGWAFE
jgi:hypothetical protein